MPAWQVINLIVLDVVVFLMIFVGVPWRRP